MRKLIALASTSLAIIFAVALANAEDTSSAPSEQPGTTGEAMTGDAQMGMEEKMGEKSPDTSAMKRDREQAMRELRMAKSCTDENGVMYKRGEKGFKPCIDAKRRQQMGGEVPSNQMESKEQSMEEKSGTMDSSQTSSADTSSRSESSS